MAVNSNISQFAKQFTRKVGKGAAAVTGGAAISISAVFAAAAVGVFGYGAAAALDIIDHGGYGVNLDGWFSTVGGLSMISFCSGAVGRKLWRYAFSPKVS